LYRPKSTPRAQQSVGYLTVLQAIRQAVVILYTEAVGGLEMMCTHIRGVKNFVMMCTSIQWCIRESASELGIQKCTSLHNTTRIWVRAISRLSRLRAFRQAASKPSGRQCSHLSIALQKHAYDEVIFVRSTVRITGTRVHV
jgi:hypothetical protein